MNWNGLLVTMDFPARGNLNADYRGVAYGKPWPLENLFAPQDNQFDEDLIRAVNDSVLSMYFHNEKGEMVSFPPAVITDTKLAAKYEKRCHERGVDTRILLCATERPWPIMDVNIVNQLLPHSLFLGYDYAYSSCDYSPLADNEQEVIDPALGLSPQRRNGFGLFDTASEAETYVEGRNQFLAAAGEDYKLRDGIMCRVTPLEDSGDFVIFKVYEAKQNFMLQNMRSYFTE